MIILLILTLKIKIEIKNIKFDSVKKVNRYLAPDYQIKISFYGFLKIKMFSISLTKTKFEKLKLKETMQKIDFKAIQDKNYFDLKMLKDFKKLKIRTNQIDLQIAIGTENAALTSILVTILATVLAVLLQKTVQNYEEQKFKVEPIYCDQNRINLSFEGIFEIKMIHIIDTICTLNKKRRVEKYERTSNRRAYDYSYE